MGRISSVSYSCFKANSLSCDGGGPWSFLSPSPFPSSLALSFFFFPLPSFFFLPFGMLEDDYVLLSRCHGNRNQSLYCKVGLVGLQTCRGVNNSAAMEAPQIIPPYIFARVSCCLKITASFYIAIRSSSSLSWSLRRICLPLLGLSLSHSAAMMCTMTESLLHK